MATKPKVKKAKLSKQALLEQKAYQRGIAAERRAWKKKQAEEAEADIAEAADIATPPFDVPLPYNLEQDVDRMLDLLDLLGKPDRMTKRQYIDFGKAVIDEITSRVLLVQHELVEKVFVSPGTAPVAEP